MLNFSDFLNFSEPKCEKYIAELLPFVFEDRAEKLLEVVEQRTLNVAPVLEHIYDRGNTCAVMRSAEAFGFVNFHVVENPESRFKAANRVARGTDKWILLNKHETTQGCVTALRNSGFKIYATHLNATTSIDEIDFREKVALVFGNEKDGVSEEMLQSCEGTFKIPMYGFAQSFNISVAAALCFYHVHQRRKNQLLKAGDLSEKEKKALLAWYLVKSVGSAEKILENAEFR